MNVVPFVHEGLGNSTYLVQVSADEALAVDPERGIGKYLRAAEERGWRITRVIETHLHADFVSGARDLANETGAEIYAAKAGEYAIPHRPLTPGERFGAGAFEVEAIASPGHTPEHLSYTFRVDDEPPVLFSGGALIVGGAARTDLISAEMTDELTHAQFRTLQTAFTSLPDETLLYPTHGSGSFCSAGAGEERTSTLGREREQNAALAMTDEAKFARWFPSTFPAVPAYYWRMRSINQRGPTLRGEIAPPPRLTPDAFEAARKDALVVDVRETEKYTVEHIPGALSNEYRDAFAVWLGWLVPENTPLLFVADHEPMERVVEEAMLVGYERFVGWLEGGMEDWKSAGLPIESIPLVTPDEAKKALLDGATPVDVREPDEYERGHVPDAIHIPLGQLAERIDEVPKDRPVVMYCGIGERSSSAASMLERAGFDNLLNVNGGFAAWRKAWLPMEDA